MKRFIKLCLVLWSFVVFPAQAQVLESDSLFSYFSLRYQVLQSQYDSLKNVLGTLVPSNIMLDSLSYKNDLPLIQERPSEITS